MVNKAKKKLTDVLMIKARAIYSKDGAKDQIVPPPQEEARPPVEGWCLIESALLGETIVLVLEKEHYKEAKAKNPSRVLYSPREVEELERLALDPDEIRILHRLKKEFKGWVVP